MIQEFTSDRFLFSPLLYELITEELQSWEIAPPFEEVLAHTGIIFRQGAVTNIDIEHKNVTVDNSTTIDHDKLVLSTGGKTPLNIVPGAIANAIPFRSLQDAYRVIEKLRLLEESHPDKIRVAIVGGGYSGVELACKIADRLGDRGRVRIIDRGTQILDRATDFNRETAIKSLEARQVWLDLETEVAKVEAESIDLVYKGQVEAIPVDLVLWTVGNQVSTLTEQLKLEKSDRGLLKINNTLQVLNHDEVYALGDIAECRDEEGNILPATAQVAFQQSDYCAWNIWAQINQKPLLPFRYQALGEMMALGVDSASLTGMGLQLDGPLAYIARRLIYLYRLPTLKHQLTVGLNWMTQPLVEFLSSN